MDLTVDVGFPHPAGDQLGVLGAEVDDQDAVVVFCRQGDKLSVSNSVVDVSRGRATHHFPSSTMISGGRGRLL